MIDVVYSHDNSFPKIETLLLCYVIMRVFKKVWNVCIELSLCCSFELEGLRISVARQSEICFVTFFRLVVCQEQQALTSEGSFIQ